ncbi:MAG: PAS domain-containing protein [Desulfopila sp.]
MTKRVLVVDDSAVTLKLLGHILAKRSLQVRCVPGGPSALEALESFQPDIIFTDLIMPELDGEALCRRIRQNHALDQAILVVVSAIGLEKNVNFQEFGAQAYIAKGSVAEMSANIDLLLTLINSGRLDLLTGMRLGPAPLVHRAITRELFDTQQYLQLLFDNTSNGVIEFSAEERITACNTVAASLFSKKPQEVQGTSVRELFSVDGSGHFDECLTRYTRTSVPVTGSHPLDTGSRTFLFKILPRPSADICAAIIVLLDITKEERFHRMLSEQLAQREEEAAERNRSYMDLNRQLQRQMDERQRMQGEMERVICLWNTTFDAIADLVSIHDKEMRIVRANKALSNFLGRSPAELVGQHCFKIMHGINHPWPDCPHLTTVKTGETTTFEVIDQNIGTPLLVRCAPIRDPNGKLLGTVHVAREITDRKNIAVERDRLCHQLAESLAKVQQLRDLIPLSLLEKQDDSRQDT